MKYNVNRWAIVLAILVSLIMIGSAAYGASDWRKSDSASRKSSNRADRTVMAFQPEKTATTRMLRFIPVPRRLPTTVSIRTAMVWI